MTYEKIFQCLSDGIVTAMKAGWFKHAVYYQAARFALRTIQEGVPIGNERFTGWATNVTYEETIAWFQHVSEDPPLSLRSPHSREACKAAIGAVSSLRDTGMEFVCLNRNERTFCRLSDAKWISYDVVGNCGEVRLWSKSPHSGEQSILARLSPGLLPSVRLGDSLRVVEEML